MAKIDIDKALSIFSRREQAWVVIEREEERKFELDPTYEWEEDLYDAPEEEKIDLAMQRVFYSFRAGDKESSFKFLGYVLDVLTKKAKSYGFDARRSLDAHPQLLELGEEVSEVMISEVKRTLTFMKEYGGKLETLIYLASRRERLIDVFMAQEPIKDLVFSATQLNDFEDVIHCAGSHLRMTYALMFMTYESRYASEHLKRHQEIAKAIEEMGERAANMEFMGGAATLHRLWKTARDNGGTLDLNQSFEVSFTMIGWMEIFSAYYLVDSNGRRQSESSADLFRYSREYDTDLRFTGPFMTNEDHSTTSIYLNPLPTQPSKAIMEKYDVVVSQSDY